MMEKQQASQRIFYDTDFKLRIIAEIESGSITAWGARQKYGIGGKTTVNKWLRKLGKGNLLGREVKLEMSKKADKNEELKERNKLLESALANAQLKILALEALVDVASVHYGENIKKNFGSKVLKRLKRKKFD